MFRRVVVARGSTEPGGYGENHGVVCELLDRAMVPGWTKAGVVEDSASSRVASRDVSKAVTESGADLLHISCQNDAHLVPNNPKFPVVVSIRDLFDFRPRAVEAGESTVALGNRYPSSSRARELESCRQGFRRADLLLCSSEMTKVEAEVMFPETPCTLVRDSVDASFWDPIRNPRERSMLGDFSDEEKCLIVSVGEKDPRWRSHFVSEVMSLVPAEVREDLNLMRIGVGSIDWDRIAAAFQHAEAMIYPGVSIGFRSPPMEAMAAGCPVLASDLPLHDEVLPAGSLLPPTDPDIWVSAILEIHTRWRRSGGAPRLVDEDALSFSASKFGREPHGVSLSRSYDRAMESGMRK